MDPNNFTRIFSSNGFEDKEAMYRNKIDGLQTRKFVKLVGNQPVSIDALVDGVRCRQTEAVWREEEFRQSSKERRVNGVTGSVPSKVASRELLITMKLHSGRNTDLKDVVMLLDSVDWVTVTKLADRGIKSKVVSQLNKAINKIRAEEFGEQLRSFFGSKQREQKRINVAIDGINKLLISIS